MHVNHRTTEAFYRKPTGALPYGAKVRLRLDGTGHDPERAEVRVWNGAERRLPMRALGRREDRWVYEAAIELPDHGGPFWYRFELVIDGEVRLLGAPAGGEGQGEGLLDSEESFQITLYDPQYRTPRWMREGVMYQIMVDRFCRGEGTESLFHAREGERITLHENWDDTPLIQLDGDQDNAATDFFGGNLEGVRQKLPYLRDLGVTILYFNPIFRANSNHKYDTGDYRQIDPMFGSEEDFRRLCAEARAMGMRVVLDGVFSHVGDDSVYFNRRGTYGTGGAYRDPHSPYSSWFRFKRWPDQYECWWDYRTLPNVEENDEGYRRFILRDDDAVVRHWLRAGASGWRLDVADELPMDFLRELRRSVKSVDEDALVLGEVWEDASHKVTYGELRSYVSGDTLDSVMNYPLREALIDFLLGRKDAHEVASRLSALMANYPPPFLYSTMNLMGSHDRPRILNVLAEADGEDLPRAERGRVRLTAEQRMLAQLRAHLFFRFLVSMPGVPCVYYGDEAGVEGCGDPFCRRTFPWGKEDREMQEETRAALWARRKHPVLQTGTCRVFSPCRDVLGVVRAFPDGRDVFGEAQEDQIAITLINRSARAQRIFLDRQDVGNHALRLLGQGAELTPVGSAACVTLPGLMGTTLIGVPR